MNNDNTRRYELPGINELNKAQKAINYLDQEGPHLIIGGPGTGKSVVSLLRTQLLGADKIDYLFLVYNILLEKSSKQLIPGLKSALWISWIFGEYRKLFGESPPKKSAAFADIDWNQVEERILEELEENSVSINSKKFMVADEGQDMPPGFYRALMAMGVENIFVAADQNQQITEFNSNLKQLRETLDVEKDEIIKLNENFRQKKKGYRIALLADTFYPDDPGTTRPELPQKTSTETPWLYTYSPQHFEYIIERIIKIVIRNPKELVGIITFNNATREKYFDTLNKVNARIIKDVGEINISTYYYGIEKRLLDKIRFDRGGIMVLNAKACKGLEFDTVFIADVHDFYCDQDSDSTKRLFYVMVARARERVFLLKEQDRHCPVEEILPTNTTILQRN